LRARRGAATKCRVLASSSTRLRRPHRASISQQDPHHRCGRGLPRRRQMKVLKAALTLVVVVSLVSAVAYLVGRQAAGPDAPAVAAHRTDHGIPTAPASTTPASPETSAPSSAPTTDPSSAPTTAPATPQRPPVPDVLSPGAQGVQVRELQQRLHQLAWLP